jgi:hypothetical protein
VRLFLAPPVPVTAASKNEMRTYELPPAGSPTG